MRWVEILCYRLFIVTDYLLKICKFISNNRGALKAEIIPIEPGTGNAV